MQGNDKRLVEIAHDIHQQIGDDDSIRESVRNLLKKVTQSLETSKWTGHGGSRDSDNFSNQAARVYDEISLLLLLLLFSIAIEELIRNRHLRRNVRDYIIHLFERAVQLIIIYHEQYYEGWPMIRNRMGGRGRRRRIKTRKIR